MRLAFEVLGLDAQVTDRSADILTADRVVFPGVGAAGAAMKHLESLKLADTLREVVRRGTPFLGICLGTQIILGYSEEDGGVPTIGLVPGRVRLFRPVNREDKVPQIGWNGVRLRRPHPIFEGIDDGSEFYFVHSYYPDPENPGDVAGVTDYAGVEFASVIGRGNLVATQFHPEKSGRIGLRLFQNFSRWDGRC